MLFLLLSLHLSLLCHVNGKWYFHSCLSSSLRTGYKTVAHLVRTKLKSRPGAQCTRCQSWLNLFLPFQCNCRRNEKQKKLGTILNYFRFFFVVFWKYLHISDHPFLTANICRTWNNWIYCFSLMMQIYLPPGISKIIVERLTYHMLKDFMSQF